MADATLFRAYRMPTTMPGQSGFDEINHFLARLDFPSFVIGLPRLRYPKAGENKTSAPILLLPALLA